MDKITSNELMLIYEKLFACYGDLDWWPAKTPYEVIVGAVLTQNTAWRNVEKAIANFGENLVPDFISNIDLNDLIEIIKPAGFFNQKAGYLKSVTAWYAQYNYDVPTVQQEPLEKMRTELLSVKGVGQETADAMLLYAFGYQTFVVDAYTVRLCKRYPIDAGENYLSVKNYFEKNLPKDTALYKNFHASIVMNAKDHCKKRNPACDICPIVFKCAKII